MGAVGNSPPRFLRWGVFQGAVKMWETCFLVFHIFTVPAASTGLWHPGSMIHLVLPHTLIRAQKPRQHNEIFGHQRGGPVLKVETLALTMHQD